MTERARRWERHRLCACSPRNVFNGQDWDRCTQNSIGSSVWMAGSQALVPFSTAFADTSARIWNSNVGCQRHRQQLNTLCSNSSPKLQRLLKSAASVPYGHWFKCRVLEFHPNALLVLSVKAVNGAQVLGPLTPMQETWRKFLAQSSGCLLRLFEE